MHVPLTNPQALWEFDAESGGPEAQPYQQGYNAEDF
jgi:hypothetical protein